MLLAALLSCTIWAQAQPVLQPSIGIGALPNDSDAICYIPPFYSINYDSVGYQVGDTVADFTLHQLDGTPVTLSDVMSDGKPVVLMSGSYTCIRFRNNKDVINDIQQIYGSSINVLIIYIVEPHVIVDWSPYRPEEWVTLANQDAGILYRQPTTYGERKAIAYDMLDSMNYQPTMLIDGPCNNWWLNYGQGPNRGYLIEPNGVVNALHGWFDGPTMMGSIDYLLQVIGVEEHTGAPPIKTHLYPNPVHGNASLYIEGEERHYDLTLTDASGRTVLRQSNLQNGQNKVELEVTPGIYFYRVTGKHQTSIAGKLVVQ